MDAYSLGQYLREARETRELSLQQAEADLKIRRFILEAFEAGDFGALDVSPVQIRGFLRNYARFLGLDEDTVIQYYDSSQQPDTRRRGRRPQAAQEP
ncbi:MAG TPA: helix-turn-helix domain-containing protein, partial [Aggregatilineales bacterium]|nr:helix-turn-helix domain-containing protein [Aggregatilineales bacterium]